VVLLIDLKTSDVTGPLSQFQSVIMEREGIWKLISDVNKAGTSPSGDEGSLEMRFEALWPKMETELSNANQRVGAIPQERSDREIIEEILALVRRQSTGQRALSELVAWYTIQIPKNVSGKLADWNATSNWDEAIARLLRTQYNSMLEKAPESTSEKTNDRNEEEESKE
jgi:hypothetical protein